MYLNLRLALAPPAPSEPNVAEDCSIFRAKVINKNKKKGSQKKITIAGGKQIAHFSNAENTEFGEGFFRAEPNVDVRGDPNIFFFGGKQIAHFLYWSVHGWGRNVAAGGSSVRVSTLGSAARNSTLGDLKMSNLLSTREGGGVSGGPKNPEGRRFKNDTWCLVLVRFFGRLRRPTPRPRYYAHQSCCLSAPPALPAQPRGASEIDSHSRKSEARLRRDPPFIVRNQWKSNWIRGMIPQPEFCGMNRFRCGISKNLGMIPQPEFCGMNRFRCGISKNPKTGMNGGMNRYPVGVHVPWATRLKRFF